MTRQKAKDITLLRTALAQEMDNASRAFVDRVVNNIGLGDIFTFSREGLIRTFEAGFKAGANVGADASYLAWQGLPMRPKRT